MLKVIFHTDPGHGWLEVPKALVEALGVQVSPFSYEHNGKYFLEEDLDAPTFDKAAKEAGIKTELLRKEHGTNNPIRSYSRVNDPNYVSPFSN